MVVNDKIYLCLFIKFSTTIYRIYKRKFFSWSIKPFIPRKFLLYMRKIVNLIQRWNTQNVFPFIFPQLLLRGFHVGGWSRGRGGYHRKRGKTKTSAVWFSLIYIFIFPLLLFWGFSGIVISNCFHRNKIQFLFIFRFYNHSLVSYYITRML